MTTTKTRNPTRFERDLARRVFTILAAACVATLVPAAASGTEQVVMASTVQPFVSMSAYTSSGASEGFYSVPGGKAFHMTQACVEHTAMTLEVASANGTFSVGTRGCTSFRPAYVVDGSATFHCNNRSGLTRSCRITGRVVDDTAAARRAVFIDVEAELADE